MSEDERGERLRCGFELGSLVDQVAEGLPAQDPAHQAVCPHCQAALRELEELWGHVRELAREDVVPPERVARRVIRRVREQLAALGRLPLEVVVPRLIRHALLDGPRGTTRIADSVVALIVKQVARGVRGVHSLGRAGIAAPLRASVRVETAPGVLVEVSGHRVAIAVELVTAYATSIPDVAAAVRRRVIENVEAMTGLEVVEVSITVVDVRGPGG